MNLLRIFITFLTLLFSLNSLSQTDGDLNSIGLEDFKHFKGANAANGEGTKMKPHGKDQVLLFKPLFLVKGKGKWYYDADSCGVKKVRAIKLAYMAEGTKVIYCGLSFDAGVSHRKTLRAVSYPILEELNVGDTLRFTLTLLADKDKKFQPLIYLSEKVKKKQGKLNNKHLTFMGAVPAGSSGDQDLVINIVEIPVTEELKKMKWVHIVNNEDEMHKGFIIENDYREGEITHEYGFQKVFFSNDSYSISKEGKETLDAIVAGEDTTTCISLRGYADPSGEKEYNLRLAQKRAQAVQKYFWKKGIEKERIVIEHFDILHNESAEQSRVCTILVL